MIFDALFFKKGTPTMVQISAVAAHQRREYDVSTESATLCKEYVIKNTDHGKFQLFDSGGLSK